jgi:GntR family transcriptional regulator, carbon starvation induced regulator
LILSADGLVEHLGHRGFRVPQTSTEELADITLMRCHLSCWALRRSIERGGDEWEGLIVAAFHRLDKLSEPVRRDPEKYLDEWEARNREFHHLLEGACGSPWLMHFTNVAYSQSERYRRRYVDYSALMPESQEEHRLILGACLTRDADAAARHLEAHIRKGVTVVHRSLIESKTAGVS